MRLLSLVITYLAALAPAAAAQGGTRTRPSDTRPAPESSVAPADERWVSGTAARVNQEVITEAEVWADIRRAVVGLPPERRKALYERRLVEMILEKIVDQAAARFQLQIDETRIRARLEAEKERVGGEAAFRDWLNETGVTEDQHVENLLNQSKRDFYIRSFAGVGKGLALDFRPEHNIEPTAREIRRFYRDHLTERYTVARSARVRYMPIRFSRFDLDPQKTLKEAERVREELLTGADFETLARRYASEGDEVSGRVVTVGGGRTEAVPVPPEVEEWAFEGEVGRPSEPLRFPRGYFLVRVEDRQPARVLPFSEVQGDIVETLRNRKYRKALREVQLKLLRKAYIYPETYKRRILEGRR